VSVDLENNVMVFKTRSIERRVFPLQNAVTTAQKSFRGNDNGPEIRADVTFELSEGVVANSGFISPT
jgi:hypothetical protein